jgi:hypothetical protein
MFFGNFGIDGAFWFEDNLSLDSLKLMQLEMISQTIDMVMDYQCLVTNYFSFKII